MLEITIPGRAPLQLDQLILDYNGTLAGDGVLLPELVAPLHALAQHLTLHVLTADTHGNAVQQLAALPCRVAVIDSGDQIAAKQRYLHQWPLQNCAAIGNGCNDQWLLRDAALGIAVLAPEGLAVSALQCADIVVDSCSAALELLLKPARLIATLRC